MSTILCQTHAKSESLLSSFSPTQIISNLYYHDPAIFKSLPGEVHPILLMQELQAIKFKQDNNSYTKHVKSIKLLHDDCHKQGVLISESHNDSNRCTPCRGKPNRHATRIPRSIRVWSRIIRISHGQHIATLHDSLIDLDGSHCS
jgi:hypothetical protein